MSRKVRAPYDPERLERALQAAPLWFAKVRDVWPEVVNDKDYERTVPADVAIEALTLTIENNRRVIDNLHHKNEVLEGELQQLRRAVRHLLAQTPTDLLDTLEALTA